MQNRFRCLATLSLCLVSPWAGAQTLGDCRRLADDVQRLACYDRLIPVADANEDDNLFVEPAGAPEVRGDGLRAETSLLGRAWDLDTNERGTYLRVRQYKPVYVLPVFYSGRMNQYPSSPSAGHSVTNSVDLQSSEAKYQLSLKTKLVEDVFGNNGDLWFGYTQVSHWQVFNAQTSRPFRETNYEPEAMLVWRTDYSLAGWRGRYASLSLNHQSNGRSLPLSRSWNRVIAAVGFEKDEWTLTIRPWWRIPESSSQDDNPDISNYLGRADIQLTRHIGDHELSLMLRHSLRGGANSHGALQLDYAFPLAGGMRGHLQWFSGYGESMIDYNHRANYYGAGVSLLEWY